MGLSLGSLVGGLGGTIGLGTGMSLLDFASARQAQLFEAGEASKMRAFTERMSNTEVQRRAADLRAAGFNPMLSFMRGEAASSPTSAGSMASGNRAKPVESLMAMASARLMESQAKLADAQSAKTVAETSKVAPEITHIIAGAENLQTSSDVKRLEAEVLRIEVEKLRELLPDLIRQVQALTPKKELGSDAAEQFNKSTRSFLEFLNDLGHWVGENAPTPAELNSARQAAGSKVGESAYEFRQSLKYKKRPK